MGKITERDAEFIKAHYKGTSARAMAKLLEEETGTKVARSTILTFYQKNGLKSGCDSRFKKGHVPVNPFQKGFANLKPEQIARIQATQYKNGHIPINHKEIGTVTKKQHEGHLEYSWIKVDENKWELEHVHVWQQAYGEIPKGGRLIHLDKDSHNNSLDNLILVSNKELPIINKNGLTDEIELNKAIVNTVKLNSKLKELKGDDNA